MNTRPKEKIMLFWSGGVKSTLALKKILENQNYELVGIISTITENVNTVLFHGVSDFLLIEQAKMLKLPLQRVFLPKNCSNDVYIEKLSKVLRMYASKGITTFAFGDNDLLDVKEFREKMFKELHLNTYFPLWGITTFDLYEEFINLGFKALVTAIDQTKLDKSFLNCEFNQEYLSRLPIGSDIHTFVIFGPGFKTRIAFSKSLAIVEGPYLVSLLKGP